MKPDTVWRIAVHTTPEAEDALSELMSGRFQSPAVTYRSLERAASVVSVYLSTKPPPMKHVRALLRSDLRRLEDFGLDPGTGALSITRSREWTENWKRHFRPIQAAGLLIKPGWSRRRARKGQAEVIIDPGMAFGTGQHPTTSFCLRQLARLRRPGKRQSLLDLGTGSGILAIAAARLGYAPVVGLDFDPIAIRIALANARRNGVMSKVELRQANVRRLPERARQKYDVVCANLLGDLLIAEKGRIAGHLASSGVLVLAGILSKEFEQVAQAYRRCGLRLRARRTEKNWCSAAFEWRDGVGTL